ncbi:efflux RND transporter periplasmic adaptor subunit [Rhodoflexus caldus]|uniref:efflux RND transporter periplasmic adaptor subunit n=1 Tax=Rhodoflexus caldus TaxID=2891236 RepID=UPI00202A5177|nr:efflux RND transporter periplasmic adaptor subunit [Rhodoflexus caldus]
MKYFLQPTVGLLLCCLLAACRKEEPTEAEAPYTVSGDTVTVREGNVLLSKLKIITATAENYRPELITAGTVRAIPNLYAEIAPPFAGRVSKVHLRLGMKTQPGTPLFEIVSPAFIDAQKAFFQAKSEFEVAQLALKRQKDLKANGVGAQRDLEEAEANYQVQEKEYQNAVANLKVFGVDVEKLSLGQPLVITSPIAGEVVENEVVLGHYIREDDPPHAKVIDLSKVWVVGMVKEKDLRFIRQLDSAEVRVAAYPNRRFKGKVYHINELIDEETRSVQVLIECDNPNHELKPGMYVTTRFLDVPEQVTIVPAKAVLQMNDTQFVFVQVGERSYQRRKVTTEGTPDGRIVIRSGVQAGEKVVSEGGIYLLEAK